MEHDHNSLDKLEGDLYERTYPDEPPQTRVPLTAETPASPIKTVWSHDDLKIPEKKPRNPKILKRIVIGSIVFFVLALSIAGYVFYRGLNVISTNKINVSFVGPASIGSSQELAFDVVIENNNKIPLSNTKLYIDYPDGTKQVTDISEDLLHITEDVGDVIPKTTNRKTVKAVLFGKEHDVKQIKVTIEYGVKNNYATFKKEAIYSVELNSVPVQMTISGNNRVLSGDEIETVVTLTSNSNATLSNVLLKADYPFGYSFLSSTPSPSYDTNQWLIKTLKPGQQLSFKVRGRLEGQERDQRALHFTIGLQSKGNEKAIATEFLSDVITLTVNKAALQAALYFNEQKSDITTPLQVGTTKARIQITNTTSNTINNIQVQLLLAGAAFNPGSVVVETGSYNQATKTITWNQNLQQSLIQLGPGGSETLDFSFSTLSPNQIKVLKDSSVTFAIVSNGLTYNALEKKDEQISANVYRTAKIQSNVTLASNVTYSIGAFSNSGPVPPRVGAKTTYTVTWILSNSTSPVIDAQLEAVLPSYVRWTDKTNPTTEGITWNSNQNKVVWRLGTINAGSKRQASFQIEVAPTFNELGGVPTIVQSAVFTGNDSNTGLPIIVQAQDLTTELPTDPQYAQDPGIVQN